MNKGFTIFFAMLVSSLALAVGLAIFDLTIRELDLSGTATQSQYAIYASDTGAECVLYWDTKYTDSDNSAFGTSTASSWPSDNSNISCNSQDISHLWQPAQGGQIVKTASAATTTFTMQIAATAQTYCATVEVGKFTDGAGTLYTTIISHGYNTCAAGITRVERTLQIRY